MQPTVDGFNMHESVAFRAPTILCNCRCYFWKCFIVPWKGDPGPRSTQSPTSAPDDHGSCLCLCSVLDPLSVCALFWIPSPCIVLLHCPVLDLSRGRDRTPRGLCWWTSLPEHPGFKVPPRRSFSWLSGVPWYGWIPRCSSVIRPWTFGVIAPVGCGECVSQGFPEEENQQTEWNTIDG